MGLGLTFLQCASYAPPPAADHSPEATRKGAAQAAVFQRQGLYQWTDDEWLDLALFAESQGLPVGLMVAIRKVENGAVSYAYGQISISAEIKALYDPEFWQMAQACRTARRIFLDYIHSRHYLWGSCCLECRSPELRAKVFLRTYRRDFLRFAAQKWAAPRDAEGWARNVRILWNDWDAGHPEKK